MERLIGKRVFVAAFSTAAIFATTNILPLSPIRVAEGQQISGANTRTQGSSSSATTPQKKSVTSYMPRGYTSKSDSSRRSATGGGSSITSFTIQGSKGVRSRGASTSGGGDGADVEDLIDELAGIKEQEKVMVIAVGQEVYEVSEMSSGVDDQLRIESDNGRMYLYIADIEKITFGAREFNEIYVTVDLKNGRSVKGKIYRKFPVEFSGNGYSFAATVDQLNSVKFITVAAK